MDPMGFGGEKGGKPSNHSFSRADKLRWSLNVRSFNAAINACQEGGGPEVLGCQNLNILNATHGTGIFGYILAQIYGEFKQIFHGAYGKRNDCNDPTLF